MKRSHPILALVSTTVAQTNTNTNDLNPEIKIESCQDLGCTPPDGSICASDGLPGPERGVGIARNAIHASSSAGNLSLSLLEGLESPGFTGVGSEDYEFWDQQLFVGRDPEKDEYASGCALMMQYQGQPLPLENLPDDDTRSESKDGTTSCDGVLDVFCRDSIVKMIRNHNSSGSDRCPSLTEHVNSQLRNTAGTCGGEGTWIASFFNVSGGSLPDSDASTAIIDEIGKDECKPVLPLSYDLYKVAQLRQFYFADPPEDAAGFLGRIYGGHDGWTPVVTILYDNEAGSSPNVTFTCMKTRDRDGSPRESVLDGSAHQPNRSSIMFLLVPTLAVFIFTF